MCSGRRCGLAVVFQGDRVFVEHHQIIIHRQRFRRCGGGVLPGNRLGSVRDGMVHMRAVRDVGRMGRMRSVWGVRLHRHRTLLRLPRRVKRRRGRRRMLLVHRGLQIVIEDARRGRTLAFYPMNGRMNEKLPPPAGLEA